MRCENEFSIFAIAAMMSDDKPSVDAHFQSLHRSSATHCHLTSNHPRLCPSSANVLEHSVFVSLFPA